jgi:peptide/nickel transport system permease protein
MATAATVSRTRVPLSTRLGAWVSPLARVARQPAGAFGLVVVSGLIVLVAIPSLIAPYGPNAQDISARLQGPTTQHLLGTDDLGRDLLSRLIFGTRIEMGVAVPAVGAALLVGLLLGMSAGYVGGRLDNVLVTIMDTLQSFPAVILALVLLALLGPSMRNVIIVLAAAFTPNYARVSRALVMATKQEQFVEAERSLGARSLRIVLVHLLPNVIAPLIILMAMDLPSAIAVEAGLSFLGVGVQPPTPSWGVILADGFEYVRESPWGIIWASVTLMVTTLGFTMLGETLRDTLDPRLAGLTRRRRPA